MQGWGGVCHAGVGWVMPRGGVGTCRGGVGHDPKGEKWVKM